MWHTVGHANAINTLKRSLIEKRLSHAYLFVGPSNVGKMTLAVDLAKAVNCLEVEKPCGECNQCNRIQNKLHADLHIVEISEGNETSHVNIGINQIRDIQKKANLKPYEGKFRIFIVNEAELLSDEAANSLLKILEEPPEQVIMILLATDDGALLETVISRCQSFELRPISLEIVLRELRIKMPDAGDLVDKIACLSRGMIGWAFQVATYPELLDKYDEKLKICEKTFASRLDERIAYADVMASSFRKNRISVFDEITLWLHWWRDALMIKEGAPELVVNVSRIDVINEMVDNLTSKQIVAVIVTLRETIRNLKLNVNPRLCLEHLMLTLP